MHSQPIPFRDLKNTRDLGGMPAKDGRTIRSGKLIRSGMLYGIGKSDLVTLAGTVGLIIDFRTDIEVREKPDPVIPGVDYLSLPPFQNLTGGISRDVASFEEAFCMAVSDADRTREEMIGHYVGFVTNPVSLSQYTRFLRELLKPRDKAVLWHCTAGKDRAGIAAVLVEELLGVDREAVREDYLATNLYVGEQVKGMQDIVIRRVGELTPSAKQAIDWMFLAHADFLDAFYESVRKNYKTMDAFLLHGLKISDSERDMLRLLYLEEADCGGKETIS